MSVSVSVANPEATAPSTSYQPFQCQVCQSRFTRHENLKRHAALHSRSADEASFPCDICQITFSRRDLRHRHMKRKHPDQVESRVTKKPQNEPTPTRELRSGSDSQASMAFAVSPSETSSYSLPRQQMIIEGEMDMDSWVHVPQTQTQTQRQHIHDQDYLSLAFTNTSSTSVPTHADEQPVHHVGSWPLTSGSTHTGSFEQDTNYFEHAQLLEPSSLGSDFHYNHNQQTQQTPAQPIFNDASSNGSSPRLYIPDGLSSRDVSYLEEDWFPSPAQTARGYQLYFNHVSHYVPFLHRPTFDATETARHLGLSMLCLAYQHGEDPDCGEQAGSGARLSQRCFHRARVFAAAEEEITGDLAHNITLVQTYWLLQVCVMMYLCGEASVYGLKMHSRMISLTRFGGLTQPIPVGSVTTQDLEALWREFIKAESHKRTLLAVHQIDALWYQLFSIPRSLSHLEIKHDLPCREEYWTASSSAQWAHGQLAARQSAPLVPYSEAVRCFLSPDPDIDALPDFDLYGAINIAQFLLSSAREVSGWSAMTGRLSLERFEPLQSSLVALERLIRPRSERAKSTYAASCEATWEIAMIELLVWSPSHTSGLVGGSVDAFLQQSTLLATSCKTLYEPATKDAVQPHIDWFLRYLDTPSTVDTEPPWIALYAYKAFLIAWQLVRDGLPGAMEIVGVRDGDLEGAVEWARRVFQKPRRRQLSRLFGASLDLLVS